MNRAELNEEMMKEVNGGEYQIWTCDTNEFFACYTLKSSVMEKVQCLNKLGMDVRVCTTNIFDDDSVSGVYLAK